MAVNKGFKRLIDHIKYSLDINQQQIAERLGMRDTYLSAVINGHYPISASLIEKICDTFNLKSEDVSITLNNVNNGDGYKETSLNEELIPYIKLLPVSAIGNPIKDFNMLSDKDGESMISPVKDADLAIIVPDDSMSPEFPSGARVWLKKIDHDSFIAWGKVYVLDTINGPVIRIVNQGSKENTLLCTAINPDQKRYAPFEIPRTQGIVFGVYRPLLVLTLK